MHCVNTGRQSLSLSFVELAFYCEIIPDSSSLPRVNVWEQYRSNVFACCRLVDLLGFDGAFNKNQVILRLYSNKIIKRKYILRFNYNI